MRPLTLDHVALWVAGRDAIAEVLTTRTEMHVIDRTDRFTLLGADARRGKLTLFDAGEGLRIALVEAPTDVDYDLDHVALTTVDPDAARAGWEQLGFAPLEDGRLEVGGAYLLLEPGEPVFTEQPLLNHIGVLVESVDEHVADAE